MLVVFNAIAASSGSIAVLIVFRFLAGVGGSGVLAVGAGMLCFPRSVSLLISSGWVASADGKIV